MAVVIGNLPMVQPLFTKAVKQIGSTFASTRGGSGGESHGMSLKDMVRSRSRNPRTANALSISSSAEEIIESRFKQNKGAGIHVISETTVNTESLHENETENGIGLARRHCVVIA